jgi:hypothetical protein
MNTRPVNRIAEAYGCRSESYASILAPTLKPMADEILRIGEIHGQERVMDLAAGTSSVAGSAAFDWTFAWSLSWVILDGLDPASLAELRAEAIAEIERADDLTWEYVVNYFKAAGQGCNSGCCGCGCGPFFRRFITEKEKKERLEEYKEQLKKEFEGVEEHIQEFTYQ